MLWFEASDAGNFIQRLGRLGRHDSYVKDGQEVKFSEFMAYALIPTFVVERLFKGESPPLEVDKAYERPYFQNQVKENYRRINDFSGYYSRWGAVQSMAICRDLGHKTIRQQYAESQQKFKDICEEIFHTSLKKVYGRSQDWREEWQALSGKEKGNPILEEAVSFRGSSPLQCGLYDITEAYEGDRFKTYDLSGILSNLEVKMMTEAAFMRKLQETAEHIGEPIPKGRFQHCLAFLQLNAYREERLNWKFTYVGKLQPIMDAWKVQVLVGLQIWQPSNYWIGDINKRLKQRGLVCYVIRRPVAEVQMRLRLPMHFEITRFPTTPASTTTRHPTPSRSDNRRY
ncbi:MAG: hypothetical protein HC917_27100 [Richelia sp. SM2_1_7]|nr:hypothetical protein [Richelia sp. SM2_1_7]